MTAVNELLDNVKNRLNLASDMALAERLTVTRSLVSRWRKGETPLADERIAQICAMAKLDGPHWTAQIHAERAQSPAERAMWKSMLDRLSAVAAVLALVVFTAPGAARAKAIDSQGFSDSDQPHSVYYVQHHQSAWVRLTSLAADIAGSESSPHERPISHVRCLRTLVGYCPCGSSAPWC